MLPQENILLLSARIHPSVEVLAELDAQVALVADWEEVVEVLIAQGAGPLFYSKLPQLPNGVLIPAASREKLKQSYFITLSRGTMLYNVFTIAAELLTSIDVDFLVLKGTYLAESLYGDIGLRQLSDIDLLIREEDGGKARQALMAAGFRSDDYPMAAFLRENLGFEHYPPLVFQGVSIELHVRLNRPGEKFHLPAGSFLKNAETVTISGTAVKVPDFCDHLIHTCVHLHKHFRDGQVQFTGFNDIVNLLHKHPEKINWETLTERCSTYRCEEIVYRYLLLTAKYYQVALPAHILSTYAYSLTGEVEEQFLRFLTGYRGKHFSVETGIRGINNVQGIGMKVKYLALMLLPTRKYMVASYKIKNPSLFWCYYPYRYWIALKGLWKMIAP